jgi:alpha-L-rhamnosidase
MERTAAIVRRLIRTVALVGALAIPALGATSARVELNAPQHLRCEYLKNPLGIDVVQPRFGWWLEAVRRGEEQTAYQMLVATSRASLAEGRGNQWDSGKVVSHDSTQVAYAGKPLMSGATYYWEVRWWDKEGNASPYSQPARFEMGLLHRDQWKGQWIAGGGLLRKAFTLPGPVSRARVYVTALGYYALRVNGRKIGRNVLDPAWTTYPKRVLYRTYDVTAALKAGRNAIGVMLGGGWATQRVGGIAPYYAAPALLLQMNIELADGRQVSIASDASWQTHSGPIVSDSVYNGEVYDARLEQPGWDRPGFAAAGWRPAKVVPGSKGEISAEMMPPIRVADTLVPKSVTNPLPGVYVYDFGQNFAGRAVLHARGPRGTRIEMRFAELVRRDGLINRLNIRTAKARDIFILNGKGRETFRPRFTYHGFRYVELTGYPGTPSLDTIRAQVVHTAVSPTGSFVASNPILNRIQHLIHWSQISNLMSVPTDCDQRNERQGWMGDAQVSAEEAMMNFDMAAFYTNFIRDIRDAQKPDGEIPDTVPHKYGNYPADPAWGTAYPLLCWYMWQQYGDRRILQQNYEALKKYESFLEGRASDNVLRYSYYGDWVAVRPTPGALVSDFYYDYDTRIMASIAGILGHKADAQAYAGLEMKISAAFNKAFFDPSNGEYANGTQTANALPLFLGLVPKNRRERVLSHIANNILYQHNTHVTTGFIGVKYLMPVLTRYGNNSLAYELATQTTYPSWGYMYRRGATTLWELWQDKADGGMDSHNHIMFASVGAWFYRALGGIDQAHDTEGYRQVAIHPHIGENLRWVSATVHTIRGRVSSSWTHARGEIKLDATIPVNANATVTVPQSPEMTEVTISENGRVVWRDNHFVPGDPGVSSAKRQGNEYVFTVGSGTYHFVLSGR